MPSQLTPPPPPISTSSLPASAKPFRALAAKMAPVAPPILASDILREEVAPRTPARRAIRATLVAFSAALAFGAFAARGWLGPVQLTAPLAFEGAALVAVGAFLTAVMPLSYGSRAALATLAGIAPLALGVLRFGPLAYLGEEGELAAAAFVVMATVLPAALVFRARYRAYRGARTVLALALVLSLPAIAIFARRALDGGVGAPERALAALGLLAALASTLGFMGPETSAGCTQWAAIVVGAIVARQAWWAGAAAWAGRDGDMIAATAAAVGELMAASVVAFALFQLLAAAFGGHARQVDVHRAIGAGASEPAEPLD